MATIYMDESGDLGFSFNKGSKKYFVITFLFVDDIKPLRNLMKTIISANKKVYAKKGGVLHAYNEKPTTKISLLNKLAKLDTKIMCIYLNKEKVYTKLQNEKNVLYNYVTNILLDRVMTKKYLTGQEINLIASKKDTNKFLNQNFKSYLFEQLKGKTSQTLKIEILTPHENKGLQVVDFVSWAIFRKYEYKDEQYYNLIRGLIVEENGLFE